MAELFVVGSLGFWAVMLVWLIILWALVETDHAIWGFFSIIAYLAVLEFIFKADVLQAIAHHPIKIAVSFVVYFVLGSGWSVWRWYLFVHDKLEPYIKMKTEWLESKGREQLNRNLEKSTETCR